ncbi:hypothetical protein [Micromonospora haikouensis]|uniref:hypothetical protein n=1 Tax=Micromonospora haikouensis TaxID=686309 RepID=UPI0037B78D66
MDDAAQPSTARMIDSWLGGEHHLPVDVAAARAFEGAHAPPVTRPAGFGVTVPAGWPEPSV